MILIRIWIRIWEGLKLGATLIWEGINTPAFWFVVSFLAIVSLLARLG